MKQAERGIKNRRMEKAVEIFFLLLACVSIVAVVVICVFLFANGLPAVAEIGVADFLFGKQWRPGENKFGIFPKTGFNLSRSTVLIVSATSSCKSSPNNISDSFV